MAFSRGCTPGENWCENYILIAFPAQGRIHNRAAPKCVFYALNVKKEITQLQATTRGTFRGVRNDDKVGFYHLNNIQHSWDLCRRSDQSVLLRGGRPLEVFPGDTQLGRHPGRFLIFNAAKEHPRRRQETFTEKENWSTLNSRADVVRHQRVWSPTQQKVFTVI